MNYELKNNTLIVSREIRYHDDFVPTEAYNNFKQFFEKVVTSDMKQIAFKS